MTQSVTRRRPRFAPATVDYFSNGYCHELALELNRRTGWELWACVERSADFSSCGVHALVRLPDGRFLDVFGSQAASEVHKRWPRCVLRRVSRRYCADWEGLWGPTNRRLVTRTANSLLTTVSAGPWQTAPEAGDTATLFT